jgi:hypothetical protein
MVSKFDAYNLEKGVGNFIGSRIPILSIAETMRKDIVRGEDSKLESTKFIPLVGRLYYDLAGRGKQKREEKAEKELKSMKTNTIKKSKTLLKKKKIMGRKTLMRK